ncbi:MAG TPA: 3-deoxy-D-manno-octulosonic acid transferase [Terriglobales bacterium]|nr:3-deoxy-D-manno-octulosonic acid transferase [Terriglobales bacterium]
MYLLYSALLALALLLSLPYWLFRMLTSGKYREGLKERFGRVPQRLKWGSADMPAIWVHAVSVGEVLAVSGLISRLRERYPDFKIMVSTTTATGQKLARDRFGERNAFYFPVDFAFAIQPYLKLLRPRLVVVAETEFWPNFLRLAKQSGARIAVVNARLSDRSFPRYQRFRALLQGVLAKVDVFLTQTEEDRGRLFLIGADARKVKVAGNLKFDIPEVKPAPITASLRAALAKAEAGPVVVCGSTVQGEERMVLDAFRQVLERFPRALMILAPRHPERWPEVAEFVQRSGIKSWRRSQWKETDAEPLRAGVFLLDSIGELASVYSLATLAFVGGSLVPRGGHNIMEPAQQGVAILVGPHTDNFREVVSQFVRAGAVDVVEPDNLGKEMLHLLFQEEKRALLAQHAREVVGANSGATERTLEVLERLVPSGVPAVVPPAAEKQAFTGRGV